MMTSLDGSNTELPHQRAKPIKKNSLTKNEPGLTSADTLPASLDLFFKQPHNINLGDVIHGWVEFGITERTARITALTITFFGEVRYEHLFRHESQIFEKHSQPLWKCPSKPGTSSEEVSESLEPGLYVYDFYVGTSFQLPPSFECKDSAAVKSLVYYCEVCIELEIINRSARTPDIKSISTDLVKRREVWLHGRRAFYPQPGRTRTNKTAIYVTNVWDMSGYILATATIDYPSYQPGQTIYVNVEVLNCFRHLSVYLCLEQRAKCAIDGQLQPVKLELIRSKLGELKPEDNFQMWYGYPVWIPNQSLVPSCITQVYPGRLMEVQHWFVLRVKQRFRKSFSVDIPVQVYLPAENINTPQVKEITAVFDAAGRTVSRMSV